MEIARVYLDVSMALGFNGLTEVLKKTKVDINTLPSGKFTVFVNRKHTAFKLLVGKNILIYHNNQGRKFPLEALTEIPNFFDGTTLKFSHAIKKTVIDKLIADKR